MFRYFLHHNPFIKTYSCVIHWYKLFSIPKLSLSKQPDTNLNSTSHVTNSKPRHKQHAAFGHLERRTSQKTAYVP